MDISIDPSHVFAYNKLVDPRTHLRLISLEGHDRTTQMVTLSIITVPTHDVPPYHAVSYTWGERTSGEQIWMNGERAGHLHVQANCATVLRQLHHFSTSTYYWIDAICINQSDTEEKECQVAMMGWIFMHAECVLACIGMHQEQDDSEYLAATLRNFEAYLSDNGLASSILTTREAVPTRSPAASQRRKCVQAWRRWIDSVPNAAFERFYHALDQLAWRPYFWRIWILQELYLAKNVRIFCGYDELNLSTLLLWWRESKLRFSSDYDDSEEQQYGGSDTRPFFMDKFGPEYFENALWINNRFFAGRGGSLLGVDFEDMLYERQHPRPAGVAVPNLSMNKLLDLCKYRRCRDRRDCIYGTLTIGHWTLGPSYLPNGDVINSGTVIVPDYTESVFDLAMDLIPNFHSDLQVSELVIGMLGLTNTHNRIRQGLEFRRTVDFADCTMGTWQNPGKGRAFVQVVHAGIQLGGNSSWSIAGATLGPRQYSKIVDSNGNCYAVTVSETKPGDWVLPTHFGRGFVLRKRRAYYVIIGKAWCPPRNIPEELEMTAFMMWYDTEDLLIHTSGGLQGLADYAIDPPGEELVDHLYISFCGAANSSFAQIPGPERRYPAVEYLEYSQSIWKTILCDWQESLGIVSEVST